MKEPIFNNPDGKHIVIEGLRITDINDPVKPEKTIGKSILESGAWKRIKEYKHE